MDYTIKNRKICVKIKQVGAELSSIKMEEKEYVWQGDPKYWANQGPLLFPIVGRTKNDQLNIGGKDCTIPTHGFLSKMEFKLIKQTEDAVVLGAEYNEATLEMYPFKFKVVATYRVVDATLEGQYEIINLDDRTMPYGFGLHNGFYCLESDKEPIEDVYLEFENPITFAKPTRTSDDFMDFANRIPVIENSNILELKNEWYPKKAPVVDQLAFHRFKLCHKKRGTILEYEFSDGFELFNAWRAYDAPFLCLEPWSSQCGIYPCAKTLEEVENTKYLKINESKMYSFSVKIG